ncbi:hypothetical protein [Nocardia paucivorans]|uniref:hypothetical protein n=1 Tax=Nocardia paucivorans TaxID=114259 RepID=UPI0002E60159|nr:hypothetical protein [Nocardia paucivorans]
MAKVDGSDKKDVTRPSTHTKTEEGGAGGAEEKVIRPIYKRGWKVKLVCPSGARPPLRAFILGNKTVDGAEDAIQKAVDLLGCGMPTPPPPRKLPLKVSARLQVGTSAINPVYQKTVDQAHGRQDSLAGMDNQVSGTSKIVADKQHSALNKIKSIVAELNSKLSAFDGRKLKSAEETQIAELVAQAVLEVYDQVILTAEENAQLAEDPGNDSTKPGIPAAETVAGTGNAATEAGAPAQGAAGGEGGLGSILPILAMLPMAAVPLIGMIPDLLEQQQESEEVVEEEVGPTPQDPTLVPVVGETTLPAGGVTAPDNGQPAVLPSLPTLGRNTASRRNTSQPSGNDNDAQPAENDENVTEPVLDQV